MIQTAFLQPTKEPAAISRLLATLNHFHPVGNGIEKYLQDNAQPCSINKGKLLLKSGQVCDQVYFISQGVVRGFIKDGTKDITTWISAENEMVTSISGFHNNQPAVENIQAIEQCALLALSYHQLENLYCEFPEFNVVIRKLLQQYYCDAEGRAFIARLTNAESKYRYFMAHHSHLVNRIPLKYIASFLGVTLETLSRVRKKISTNRT